jgi:hypothetical protein
VCTLCDPDLGSAVGQRGDSCEDRFAKKKLARLENVVIRMGEVRRLVQGILASMDSRLSPSFECVPSGRECRRGDGLGRRRGGDVGTGDRESPMGALLGLHYVTIRF